MVCLGNMCVGTLHKGDNDDDNNNNNTKCHASFVGTTFRLTWGCQGGSPISITYKHYLQLFDLIKSSVSKFV